MEYELIYTEDIPKEFGGYAVLNSPFSKYILRRKPIIKIRPKYKDDIGLLNHEKKHIEQYNKYWFYNLRYRFIKSFRYNIELEAYREQILAYDYKTIDESRWIIDVLLNKYNLNVSEDKIIDDIKNIIIKKLYDYNID